MKFNVGDYIVRTWTSGVTTMGIAVESSIDTNLLFKSLENYSSEGGVCIGLMQRRVFLCLTKFEVYGSVECGFYKHRRPTTREMSIFNKFGRLRIDKDELRDLLLDEIGIE